MNWFTRKDKNINTPTSQKKELPDGMWYKTPGGSIVHIRELKNNSYVCPEDDYHVRIGSKEYFEILFDNKSFKEFLFIPLGVTQIKEPNTGCSSKP